MHTQAGARLLCPKNVWAGCRGAGGAHSRRSRGLRCGGSRGPTLAVREGWRQAFGHLAPFTRESLSKTLLRATLRSHDQYFADFDQRRRAPMKQVPDHARHHRRVTFPCRSARAGRWSSVHLQAGQSRPCGCGCHHCSIVVDRAINVLSRLIRRPRRNLRRSCFRRRRRPRRRHGCRFRRVLRRCRGRACRRRQRIRPPPRPGAVSRSVGQHEHQPPPP